MGATLKKILLIEDEPGLVSILLDYFNGSEDREFDLIGVSALADGMEVLAGGDIHALLLDLSLPDSHGLATFTRVRSLFSNLPIVVLTASVEENVGLQMIQAGAQDHLVKSQASPAVVMRSIRYALERHQATNALRESEARYRFIIEHTGRVIYEWNIPSDLIVWWGATTGLTGYAPDDVRDKGFKGWEQNVHVDDRPEVLRRLNSARANHEMFRSEYRLRRKDGTFIHVEDHGVFLRDTNGNPVRLLGTISDISVRKRAQEAFRESREYLDQIITCIGDPVFVKDAQHRIVLVNMAACELTGASQEELLGKTEADFFTSGVVSVFWHQDQIVLETNREHVHEEQIQSPQGQVLTVITKRTCFTDRAGNKYVVSVMRDISERKKAEEERQRAADEIHDLYNNAPCGYHSLDGEGYITRINDTELAWLGYKREEILSQKRFVDLIVPESREIFERNHEHLKERGWVRDIEFEMVRKDGTLMPVLLNATAVCDKSGSHVMSRCVIYDITDRKAAEEVIREHAHLLDLAQDTIVVRDMHDRIEFWNKSAERLYGWTASEVAGKVITDLIHRDSTSYAVARQELLEQGEWNGELFETTSTGKKVVVNSRWTLVCDAHGRPRSILAISTDITEKKQLETQFLRAQRLESIGQLAGGLAHDLNNILCPILMIMPMLRDEIKKTEIQGLLDSVENSAKRGADIIKQILTFSRGFQMEKSPIQTRHLLKEISNIIRETFPKTLTLKTNFAKDLWMVEGDITQLHQVLMNLSVNARDAMPDGGTLTIAAENQLLDEAYARMIPNAKPGPYVLWVVTDTGVGIPPENLDLIFDPFFTTKEMGKGTGLGLSTVLGIVRNHDGFVQVKSQVKRGTEFRIILPAIFTAPVAKEENAPPLPRGNGELLLVVDDEDSIRRLAEQTLRKFGYKVVTARDGAEAVELFFQNQKTVRLVLTDLMMPVMGGRAAIRMLRKLDSNLPIVATSGLASDPSVEDVQTLGANAFIRKPFQIRSLLETIHAALEGKPIPKQEK